ncbi:hypothetical protein AVEN_214401-1 [Araneus ventricosus]|uniref:Reverse transcriptase domain-containing protein n=1 Tax=Araneus ventricosus TaxID=182803 RepID=A0A4Y2MCA4_ARAVE|nr:hypothetical protein AVEN_214401-1 [Araneus ventricosus]
MYRQMLIDPDQQDLHRIMWKTVINAEVSAYRLKTVTYGMSNAPFLAIRALQQLVEDEKSRHPLSSEVLLHDTYMDDITNKNDLLQLMLDSSVVESEDVDVSRLEAGNDELEKEGSESNVAS